MSTKKLDGPKLKHEQIWTSDLIYESWFPCLYQRSTAFKDSLRAKCLNPWHSTNKVLSEQRGIPPFRDTEYRGSSWEQRWWQAHSQLLRSQHTEHNEKEWRVKKIIKKYKIKYKKIKSKDGEVVEGSTWWRRQALIVKVFTNGNWVPEMQLAWIKTFIMCEIPDF